MFAKLADQQQGGRLLMPRWINKKYLSVAWVSFASGLPLLLVGSTLQAWFTVAGISLMQIGLLSLIGVPYLFKFLWSPCVDRIGFGRLGRYTGWMIVTQFLLCLGLLLMAQFSVEHQTRSLALLAFIVAFLSATQDVAVDAYRTTLLSFNERGHGSAVTNIAFRVAMIVAGFLALLIAAETSFHVMYRIMAVLMLLLAIGSCWLPRGPDQQRPIRTLRSAVIGPVKNFAERFSKKEWVPLLLLVIFYKFADALALSLNTTFLLRELQFSLVTVGSIAKIASTSAILIGSVVAGFLLPKMGLYRSLWWFGWLQLITILGFCLLSAVGHEIVLMTTVMFADYFCGGLGSVAFIALLMTLCDNEFSATQYALLSALAALARVAIGPLAAWAIKQIGWFDFYFFAFLLGLPVMFLLFKMKGQMGELTAEEDPVAVESFT
jgi:PAT family beta-lactamase induction signal transducer AmpG